MYKNEPIKAIVLRDRNTSWMFFISGDKRLVDTKKLEGGVPFGLCSDFNIWQGVARFNLGIVFDTDKYLDAIKKCENEVIKEIADWADDKEIGDTKFGCGELTADELRLLIGYTIGETTNVSLSTRGERIKDFYKKHGRISRLVHGTKLGGPTSTTNK